MLLEDLDFTGITTYQPININANLNGNSKTIKNLIIQQPILKNNVNYLGIFGSVCSQFQISNLILQNVIINFGSYDLSFSQSVFAGIIAANAPVIIKNVSLSKCSIFVLGHPNVRVIGGLVGYSSNLTVINVTSNVSIDCRHNSNGNIVGQSIGGVVG